MPVGAVLLAWFQTAQGFLGSLEPREIVGIVTAPQKDNLRETELPIPALSWMGRVTLY